MNRMATLVTALAITMTAVAGCSPGSGADMSCADYLSLDPTQRAETVRRIAEELNAPGLLVPGMRTYLDDDCSANPSQSVAAQVRRHDWSAPTAAPTAPVNSATPTNIPEPSEITPTPTDDGPENSLTQEWVDADGYSYRLTIASLHARMDVYTEDAKPGESEIEWGIDGTATLQNTTKGHKAPFPQMAATAVWDVGRFPCTMSKWLARGTGKGTCAKSALFDRNLWFGLGNARDLGVDETTSTDFTIGPLLRWVVKEKDLDQVKADLQSWHAIAIGITGAPNSIRMGKACYASVVLTTSEFKIPLTSSTVPLHC